MNHPPIRHRAFTLIEMLTVFSIIVILIAVLMPSLRGVNETARTAVCATHLASLGQAYHSYGNDRRLKGHSDAAITNPYLWPTTLSEYLADNAVNTCPSDDAAHELFGGDDPSEPGYDKFIEAPGYDYYYHAQGASGGKDFDFILPMSNISYWVSLETWDGQGGNETTAARIASNRWKARHPQRPSQALILDIGYLPTVWKQPYRQDWNTATTDTGRNEHHYSFIPSSDSEIEAIGWKHFWWSPHEFRYLGDAIRDWIDKDIGAPKNHNMIRTMPKAAWESASYGMNNRANVMRGENRILLIDYPKVVANVVGDSGTDMWGVEIEKVADRHLGAINVLSYDGAVHTRRPHEIDPGVLANYNNLWLPESDPILVP